MTAVSKHVRQKLAAERRAYRQWYDEHARMDRLWMRLEDATRASLSLSQPNG